MRWWRLYGYCSLKSDFQSYIFCGEMMMKLFYVAVQNMACKAIQRNRDDDEIIPSV